MCLSNLTTKRPKTAKEDIVVYKRLKEANKRVIKNSKIYHGKDCIATIYNKKVIGKLSLYNNEIFICTNDIEFNGICCPSEFKFGFKYSWVLDGSTFSILVNGNEILSNENKVLVTPYQCFVVEIGKTYKSNLENIFDEVKIGIHSFVTVKGAIEDDIDSIIVKCIIPKGSKYYLGDFNGIKDSIASDTLKYIEIIND